MEAAGIEPLASNQQSIDTSDVTTRAKPLGVFWECPDGSNCQCMSLDDSLLRIIAVWETLPESIKKEVDAMCIQPASRDSSEWKSV